MGAVLCFYDVTGAKVGTLAVVDGKPVATGAGVTAAVMFVVEPGNPSRKLGPADGDEWLEALSFNFRTAYLTAKVEPVDEVPADGAAY
jgi:hypothetical protein